MRTFRFSLTSLLIFITIVSFWMARTSNDARRQATGVSGVEANQGIVKFGTVLDVPDWLRDAIGEEYFRDEKEVDFASNQGRRRGTSDLKATNDTLVYLTSLDNVESLELGYCREVTDDGLSHLSSLKNLKTVYLYRTGIQGRGLIHLEQLPNLRFVCLNNTEVNDSGTVHLGRIRRLSCLRLDNSKVTDMGMEDLVGALALEYLTVRNTEITDTGLRYLEQLRRLKTLDVSGTKVTAVGVARLQKQLPNCHVVTTFGLGAKPQEHLIFSEGQKPTSSEINRRLKELKVDGEVRTDTARPGNPIVSLRLFSCTFSDRVMLSLIRQMPDLEELNLRRGLCGDELLKDVGSLPIRYLSLQGTRVTDNGLRHLVQLSGLRELVLTETDVTDEGLVHLERLNQLDSIELNRTRVTATGIERLKRSLPNCNVGW